MRRTIRQRLEKSGKGVLLSAAFLSVLAVCLITLFIVIRGLPFFQTVTLGDFLFHGNWSPSSGIPSYGVWDFLVASLIVTLLFAFPEAISSSIHLALFAKGRMKKIASASIDLLSAIPSVIHGLFGIAVVVPLVREHLGGNGYSLLSASIILAIMILPTIISLSGSAIDSVPHDLHEASYGLGATKSETIIHVVLPAAKSGIVAGIILAMGRALGETTTVLLVGGNAPLFPQSVLSMGRTLTMNIVTDMSYAEGTHLSALFATAMLLYILILVLDLIAVRTMGRRK